MKPYKGRVDEVMNRSFAPFRKLPREQVEDAGQRVLDRLQKEPHREPQTPSSDLHSVGANRKLRWSVAALTAFAIAIVILGPARILESKPAILEDSTGARAVAYGELVRTPSGSGSALKFSDGSSVELRPESELSLERGKNEIRLRLRKGDVIVNVAEKPELKLQVQTEDLSAEGKVFLVSVKERGSRVAVIGGEAHVVEGASEKRLLPGEQVTTSPTMEAHPVGQQVVWSHAATAHLALLQQSVAVPEAAGENLEFEVASIRPNTSNSTSSRIDDQPERVVVSNATLEQIIRAAFNARNIRISGPALMNSRYDIEAKAPSGTPKSQLLPMLESLLRDRFAMKFHRESIEMPIYALTIAKGGHKLNEIKPDAQISGFGVGPAPRADGLAAITSIGDLKGFAASLSRNLDRPVVDKTGLSGRFRIALAYVPDRLLGITDATGSSIYTAIEEQLGLKLESQRGPVEILVIDQLQEPTPN